MFLWGRLYIVHLLLQDMLLEWLRNPGTTGGGRRGHKEHRCKKCGAHALWRIPWHSPGEVEKKKLSAWVEDLLLLVVVVLSVLLSVLSLSV